MAMILEFRSAQAPAEPREPVQSSSAQIIIFPGVRRERHEPAPSVKMRRRARLRRKRDRLQLPE